MKKRLFLISFCLLLLSAVLLINTTTTRTSHPSAATPPSSEDLPTPAASPTSAASTASADTQPQPAAPTSSSSPAPKVPRPDQLSVDELSTAIVKARKAVPQLAPGDLASPQKREAYTTALYKLHELEKQQAIQFAKANNLRLAGTSANGRYFTLEAIENGRPVYKATYNANSAITSAAAPLNNSAGVYNLQGQSITAAVWDAEGCLTSHTDFDIRATQKDSTSTTHFHHTHVAGTVAGSGASDARARGMAPMITLWNHDWHNDTTEMAAVAAASSTPPASAPVTISNHSYGPISGWEYDTYLGNTAWGWTGPSSTDAEDPEFGQYGYWERETDKICVGAPFYLPFIAAGNDRNDGPTNNSTAYFFNSTTNQWEPTRYNSKNHPPAERSLNYDTMSGKAISKNVLTVGSVANGYLGNARTPNNATMSSFSSWGPTDDGRIKPDIVARGENVLSCDDAGNTSYRTSNGTSMATPSCTGSASLIQQRYKDLFSNNFMRASTLKALLQHTADDLGNPGPDYSYGWGLINAKAAVDIVDEHAAAPSNLRITESTLNSVNSTETFHFRWDGTSPTIKATICWTDPATNGYTVNRNTLDDATIRLVNDLDIRITTPSGTTLSPWILDPANPANNATTGDNIRDVSEQIIVSAPEVGTYSITVSHKNNLDGNAQKYSLILSGNIANNFTISPNPTEIFNSLYNKAPADQTFTLSNNSTSSTNWSVASDVTWLDFNTSSGTIDANSTTNVLCSFNQNIQNLAPGTHTATLTFTNGGVNYTRSIKLNKVSELAFWKFDESSGSTASDSSGNNHTATSSGSGVSNVPGFHNNAINLTGSGSFLSASPLAIQTNSFTITAWVKQTSSQNDWSAIFFHRSPTSASGLNIRSNNTLAYHWAGSSNTWGFSSGLSIPNNQWIFIALSITPDKATFYLHDGSTLQSSSNSVAHAAEDFSANIHIGQDPTNTSRRYRGNIDDLRLFNHSLSQSEVLQVLSQSLSAGGKYAFENGVTGLTNLSDDSDTDNDNYSNLAEYALGFSPNTANPPLSSSISPTTFKLLYPHTTKPGVTITPQWSTDLQSWFNTNITISPTGAEIPRSTNEKLFLRLNIQ